MPDLNPDDAAAVLRHDIAAFERYLVVTEWSEAKKVEVRRKVAAYSTVLNPTDDCAPPAS